MAKPANPIQNAQNVHANQGGNAIDAHLDKFDITDSLNGTVFPEATFINGGGHPDMYWGNGNSPSGYHISDNNTLGIELALKEHNRSTGPDLTHTAGNDGVANVIAPAGTDGAGTHALWNFDYVVDTGLNGSSSTLADFTFKLQITQTLPNGTTNTQIFDLDPAAHVWVNETNPSSHFGGDDFAHPASALVQSQVSENSQNLAFLGGVFGSLATATQVGAQYDIQLEAFQHTQLVALVHDHVLLV